MAMTQKTTTGGAGKPAKPGRDDRLKAALKANMGRRKAQARARSADDGAEDGAENAAKTQDHAGKPAEK